MLALIALTPLFVSAVSAAAILPRNTIVERASNLTGAATTFRQPPGRAWADATDSVAPCGGMPIANRTTFPLTGGRISLLSRVDAYDIELSYSTDAEVTATSTWSDLLPDVPSLYGGHQCYNVTSLAGLATGTPATFQVKYKAGIAKTTLYSCADVTLVTAANWVQPQGWYCIDGALEVPTADTQNYADEAASAAAPAASASPATRPTGAAGHIVVNQLGAMAMVAVGIFVLA